jgi:hypothetical protein
LNLIESGAGLKTLAYVSSDHPVQRDYSNYDISGQTINLLSTYPAPPPNIDTARLTLYHTATVATPKFEPSL